MATWPLYAGVLSGVRCLTPTYRLSDADRQALLTWIIVGGGPTGSELAAELHDLVEGKQFRNAYPLIAPDIRIKLIDAAPTILSTFDKRLAQYAAAKFRRAVGLFFSRKCIPWLILAPMSGNRSFDLEKD